MIVAQGTYLGVSKKLGAVAQTPNRISGHPGKGPPSHGSRHFEPPCQNGSRQLEGLPIDLCKVSICAPQGRELPGAPAWSASIWVFRGAYKWEFPLTGGSYFGVLT